MFGGAHAQRHYRLARFKASLNFALHRSKPTHIYIYTRETVPQHERKKTSKKAEEFQGARHRRFSPPRRSRSRMHIRPVKRIKHESTH